VRIPTVNDMLRAGTEQVEALAALPRSVVVFNRSLANFAQTLDRLDELVRRLDRMTGPLEAPLTALAPRLEALVPLLDEEVTGSLPAVLDSVQRNALPALELMGETRAHVATMAASVERLTAIMEDGFTRLLELPGVSLVNRIRGGQPPKGAGGDAGAEEGAGADRVGTAPTAARGPGGQPVEGAATSGTPPRRTGRVPGRPAPIIRPAEEHRSWRG
jgi:hypothetical protein